MEKHIENMHWERRREYYKRTYEAKHQEELKMFTLMAHLAKIGMSLEMNKRICDDVFANGIKVRKGFQENLDRQRIRRYKRLNRKGEVEITV